jgi:hypothetical protein
MSEMQPWSYSQSHCNGEPVGSTWPRPKWTVKPPKDHTLVFISTVTEVEKP